MLDKIIKETEGKMDAAIDAVDRDLKSVRTGRATTSMVDGVKAQAYGNETPLNQLASITTPDAATIMIQPWDASVLKSVEKALLEANLGMTPSNDGKVIRLVVPTLTEEKRKEMVKKAHAVAEHGRVAIRNLRRHVNDEVKRIEKDHKISEDEKKRYLDQIQKKTDAHIAKIDEHMARKEAEIMKV